MKSFLKRLLSLFIKKDPAQPQIMPHSLVDKYSSIGNYTYIGYNCLVTKATIGSYCSIANNCSIGPGEHDINKISTNSIFYENPFEELTKRSVELGHDVWIGANVVIRRGVKIGNGAVIGANSFVNSDIPDYAVYAGSPARFIKYRFDEELRVKINDSKWWDLPPAQAKEVFQLLTFNH